MTGLFTSKAGAGAHPLLLLTEEAYKGWLKKQPARITNWIQAQSFKPKSGSHLVLPSKEGGVDRVLAILSSPISLWDLASLPAALPKGVYAPEGKFTPADLEKLYTGWLLGGYAFETYKSKKKPAPAARLYASDAKAAATAKKLAEATAQVRELITTPASHLGPEELAQAVKETLAGEGVEWTEIVGEALLKRNYPAIYAVGKASARPPRLIDVRWGNPKHPLVTLVGKGVVFDTGGLDLKPSGAMFLMRKDMGGAAVALGTARLIIENKLPVRLRLLIPAVENSIAGNAFRPSDILTMRNGQTVEVGNTDAEGRLILADCLSDAASEKPALLVDFATLTGAARSAVGTSLSAYFTDDQTIARDFENAAEAAEDPVWRLPLFDGYEDMLRSSYADMNSAPSSPYAGAITAALFLRRFAGKSSPWLHLDFMAWNTSSKAGRPEGGEAMALRAVYGLIAKRFAKN